MRKQELEALRRLEAALLEQQPKEEEIPVENEDFPDDTWLELVGSDYESYNTDAADVDLDVYSEDVHRGKRSHPFLSFLIALSLLLLAASIWIFLRFLGVV